MTTPVEPGKTWWPRAAASAAVFRGAEVLIIQRGKGAASGRWSLPGGHVEPGETAAAAAAREVMEETAVAVRLHGLLDLHDVISYDADGSLRAHYLLAVYFGTAMAGEPVAATDAAAARFVPLTELAGYDLTESAIRFIDEGYKRFTALPGTAM